jgi:hypothetical protein
MTKLGVSYFLERSLKRVEEDMREVAGAGFSVVVHTFTEHDARYNLRRMEELVRVSEEVGLEVWGDPWGVAGIFGGESFSRFLALNPDAVAVGRDGSPVYSACLNSETTYDFVMTHIGRMASVGFHNIFLDEVHVKGGGCWCGRCRDLFRRRIGVEMDEADEEALRSFFKETVKNFTVRLIEGLRDYIQKSTFNP